jgi:hypothetical protein
MAMTVDNFFWQAQVPCGYFVSLLKSGQFPTSTNIGCVSIQNTLTAPFLCCPFTEVLQTLPAPGTELAASLQPLYYPAAVTVEVPPVINPDLITEALLPSLVAAVRASLSGSLYNLSEGRDYVVGVSSLSVGATSNVYKVELAFSRINFQMSVQNLFISSC